VNLLVLVIFVITTKEEMTKESREEWLEKACEICGEKRVFHNVQQTLDCQQEIARRKRSLGT